MPNWTDEDGKNWYGKLECKRCLNVFEHVNGEVPIHKCIDGYYKSEYVNGVHHYPVPVSKKELLQILKKGK